MTATRIGVLSTADFHFDAYAELLSNTDAAEFVGIADTDTRRGRQAANKYDTDLRPRDELLDDADGVFVFSTYTSRLEWISAAAEAGVDVICEKPLATTVERAEEILAVCEDHGVNIGMIMPLRFADPSQRAKQELSNDAIGDVRTVSSRNRCALRDRHVLGWTANPTATGGGGSVMHHSEHVVDLVGWLTDESITEVYAELGYAHGLDVEDANVVHATLSNGATVTIDTSWSTPDADEFWGDATVELVGTRGTISVNCFGETVKYVSDDKSQRGLERLTWGSNANERLLHDFVDAIEADRPPETTGRDGLEQVAVIEAIYESADEHKPVPVDVDE